MKPRIGITSRMIKEITDGPLLADEVDLIELNLEKPELISGSQSINYAALDKIRLLGREYSIHGPYNSFPSESKNLQIMEMVCCIGKYLDAADIVIHTHVVEHSYEESLSSALSSLKQYCQVAAKYHVNILLENMISDRHFQRLGVTPSEVLDMINAIDEKNLKFCFDVGHANLAASQFGFDVLDFIDLLKPYLCHVHVHDNMGIPSVVNANFGDQHLPLGKGKIDYRRVFEALNGTSVKNVVLELLPSNTSKEEALRSIDLIHEYLKGSTFNWCATPAPA